MGKYQKSPFVYLTSQVGYKGIALDLGLEEQWCNQFAPPEGARAQGDGSFVGKLLPSGTGFVLKGDLSGTMFIPCNRCLEDVECRYDASFTHYYTTNEEEAEEDGFGVTAIASDEINVEPILGEELVLALPTYVLCKEGCVGLCVQCGANLNAGECACEAPTDPRWDKLKDLKLGS